jgi:hypothetical protein
MLRQPYWYTNRFALAALHCVVIPTPLIPTQNSNANASLSKKQLHIMMKITATVTLLACLLGSATAFVPATTTIACAQGRTSSGEHSEGRAHRVCVCVLLCRQVARGVVVSVVQLRWALSGTTEVTVCVDVSLRGAHVRVH